MKFFCNACKLNFENQKGLQQHEKTMKHQYKLEEIKESQERHERRQIKKDFVKIHKTKIENLIKKFQIEMADIIIMKEPQIDFSKPKNLSESIQLHYYESRPTEKTLAKRKCFLEFITQMIQTMEKDSTIKLYGSVVSGLDDNSSDLDIGVNLNRKIDDDSIVLNYFMSVINSCEATNINVYGTLSARVPIITITDSMSDLQADISLRSADDKLKLFKEYLKIDPRTLPFLKAIKFWAKKRNICHSISGTINSFGYCCMGIAVLQNVKPPILPNLQYNGQIDSGDKFQNFSEKNTMSLGELLIEFFKMILEFDYEKNRISILHGGFCKKESEKFIHNTLFCVEDPIEPFVNFSRHVNEETIIKILDEFKRAKNLLEKGSFYDEIL